MKKVYLFFICTFMCSTIFASKNDTIANTQTPTFDYIDPEVYAIMDRFEKYLDKSELSKTHQELIRIRASQLNHCGYCLNLHSQEALKAGESEARIYMLPLWKNVPQFYTDEELVILQMTEDITFIQNGLADDTYIKAKNLFSEKYISQVITAIIVINAWNRIGVTTKMEGSCKL